VESATGYKQWLHGEAIGAGLLMAAAMSRECGLMSAEDVLRVQKLIARTGLPTYIEGVSPETAFGYMRIDKKVQSGRIRLILLRKIGDAFITADYSEPALEHTLREHFGPPRG
jgi:3-dehydroquinate synthase